MTSIYDVLKASKSLPVDDIFAELWGRKLSSDYTIDVYTGTLPAVLTGTKAGYLQRYKVYGNVGENLLEIEPEMLNEANWTLRPAATATYFMYYQLRAATAERLKEVGTIAGTVYLVAGGTYYNGEILAITSETKASNVTTSERLLQNNGTPLQYTADVEEYANIYLCIGYGSGITSSNKQPLINEFFNNFRIMLVEGSSAPSIYIPYEECGEKSANLFDKDDPNNDGYINGQGEIAGKELYSHWLIPVTEGDVVYINNIESAGIGYSLNNGQIVGSVSRAAYPYTVPAGITHLTNNWVKAAIETSMVTKNVPIPSAYTPYGYKLPLLSGSTPIDIYIGDDTLSDSECVDSSTGKIYRMVGGTLTPVDPPVPFPQIPTVASSTTISWAGEGLAPSQVELEYERK